MLYPIKPLGGYKIMFVILKYSLFYTDEKQKY